MKCPLNVYKSDKKMKLFQTIIIILSLVTHLASASEKWEVESLGSFEIDLNIPEMGGLSALNITSFGKKFITISDKGKYFQGTINRNRAGLINNINVLKTGFLLNSSGKALTGRNTDSESMTTTQKRGFYISFESNDRIMFHESLTAPGEFLPKHNDFKLFDKNKGLEAIASNSKGELHAIPEAPQEGDSKYPIYKLVNDKWVILARFFQSKTFLVTDAVFLPDNSLLLLERDYNWGVGFKMQLRVLTFDMDTITGQNVIFSLDSGLHNYEGISIWQDKYGNYYATLISDNNFLPFVNSKVKEFKLKKIN